MTASFSPRLDHDATGALLDTVSTTRRGTVDPFTAARQLAPLLGAHPTAGGVRFAFWTPELFERGIAPDHVYLEVLRPPATLDLTAPLQTIRFRRRQVQLSADDDYLWGVVTGLRAGTRHQPGDFYRLVYHDEHGQRRTLPDPLAASIPFGVNAPAEIYDIDRMQADRADRDHFARLNTEPDPDGVPRITAPANILQVHIGTATAEGTLAGLTGLYRRMARKIENGEPLTPAQRNYLSYDAVQLMPIEPIIEYEAGPHLWHVQEATEDALTVSLRTPDMTNWGYDVIIAASPAVNPVLLGSKRPDELVDFIATLHNFPTGPIMVLLDVVYGHADNQSLPLMDRHYFAGPNMYGQNLSYRNPVVRAILLEMQRRKSNYGVDGLRVDGAQDFKWWEAETDTLHHDDEYLALMNNVEQQVAGQRYRPWMIFEDGRPWPRDDWELASSYREVTKQLPNVYQWGPLTFAHNTPFLFTFWISKWWRLREIAAFGEKWITGCANHDTLRRGTQVDPLSRVNTYLGDTLPDVLRAAYDNPAATLLTYACLPGVPMDFITASCRAPWSFIRNTGDRWIVKVMSEEARFVDWVITDDLFHNPDHFPRLKALGFTSRADLHAYLHALDHLVKATGYDLDLIARLIGDIVPAAPDPAASVDGLKRIARAWMDDLHALCNLSHYADQVDEARAAFNESARAFRRAHPWLAADLRPGDTFSYLHPTGGAVLFCGLRRAPDEGQMVLFLASMEGEPHTLTPTALPLPGLPPDGWEVALSSPGLNVTAANQPLTLVNSQGVVFTRSG